MANHEHHNATVEVKDILNITDDDLKLEEEKYHHAERVQTPREEKKNSDQVNTPDDHSIVISANQGEHKDDMILTAKQKRKQIKDDKKKEWFARICKYVFYIIFLFSLYIIVKRLFIYVGIIVESKSEVNEDNSINGNLEMKSACIKKE